MLVVINVIRQLEEFLKREIQNNSVIDFRIALKLNMEVSCFVLVRIRGALNYEAFKNFELIRIEEITLQDCENDEFYSNMFSPESEVNKIDFGLRRRLNNLINVNLENKEINNCPVITFYSYKGGMGRSTALASFAAHYSYHLKKKVVILDCDFEAPGFTNYFDLNDDILSRRNGVVEYLLDKQFLNNGIDIKDYLFEISKEYSGEGEIHIMPAGNLSDSNIDLNNPESDIHRNHYLEGLARIDISNTENIVQHFKKLFKEIEERIKPDVILIDSRTGFNDIFGTMAFHLSSLIIGFFGNNIQTNPGLHFFIDTLNSKKNIPLILVNSIISSGKLFESFEQEVNNYINANLLEGETVPALEMYPIYRDPILERVGTKDEYKPDYLNLIKNQSFNNYKNLFNGITKAIDNKKEIEVENATTPVEVNERELIPEIKADEVKAEKGQLTPIQILSFKRKILDNLKKDSPKLYAKDAIFSDETVNKKFYFRKCMEDIFNRDLYLIIGNKGTGKTFLYNALKQKQFIKQLKIKANKSDDNYSFINIISVKDEQHANKLLQVSNHFKVSELDDSDYFFNRFWIVYIWNSIMLSAKSELGFNTKLNPRPIKNDAESAQYFMECINSNEIILNIEDELKALDEYLKTNKRNLIILFDELDYIVKPVLWDKGVAPLINFWRTNPYSRIFPKLFIRSDLFEKLGNINNKQDLKKQSISIEWNQEELFAFFFKIIFSNSKTEFYNVMYGYNEVPEKLITEIKQASGFDNQVPLNPKYLKPLVETFFGKWADRRKEKSAVYGESYDWFYRNLKNADNTISLRPFLDLINQSIEHYTNNELNDREIKPILSSYYFTDAKSRAIAVENHFKDLSNEEGNRDLEKIFEYIKLQAPLSLRKQTLNKVEFETLITGVIKKYDTSLENKTIDSIREFLIVNGVISFQTMPGGKTLYNFALLYKYYLGLSNKRPPVNNKN